MRVLRQLQLLRITRPGRFWTAIGIGGLACSILTTRALPARELPSEPVQRCATKALRGDFGELEAWQAAAYRMVLERGVRADRTARVTPYYGTEPDGKIDRRDRACTLRHVAANSIPYGHYVWTELGVRQVLDCGASWNDRVAREKGTDLWLDYWWPSPAKSGQRGTVHLRCAVIGGR